MLFPQEASACSRQAIEPAGLNDNDCQSPFTLLQPAKFLKKIWLKRRRYDADVTAP
jgi:hypothetical protein